MRPAAVMFRAAAMRVSVTQGYQ